VVNGDDFLRVAIAAPSEAACARLEALLATASNVTVVGSASPTALADLLLRVDPDVLVLELGAEPAAALERLGEAVQLPATVLLVADAHSERDWLHLGVRAVLPPGVAAKQLAAAIAAVAVGLVVLDDGVAGSEALSEDAHRSGASIEALTPRETEVLQLVADGLPNKEIAAALHISEHTVKFHLSTIFSKLGAASRTEAVAIGIRHGILMI
jgi:two-component system, NarL family, response regulator YdfI